MQRPKHLPPNRYPRLVTFFPRPLRWFPMICPPFPRTQLAMPTQRPSQTLCLLRRRSCPRYLQA